MTALPMRWILAGRGRPSRSGWEYAPAMRKTSCFVAIGLAALASTALAQQTVPFARGVPVAPTGLEGQPLGAGPWTYRTAEGMDVTVSVLARLEWPYAMAFLPN